MSNIQEPNPHGRGSFALSRKETINFPSLTTRKLGLADPQAVRRSFTVPFSTTPLTREPSGEILLPCAVLGRDARFREWGRLFLYAFFGVFLHFRGLISRSDGETKILALLPLERP